MAVAVLADRISDALRRLDDVTQKSIVGGIGFMWHGNLLCGVVSGDLVVRVGKAAFAAAVAEPGTRPMSMGDRASSAWVIVNSEQVADDATLYAWLERGRAFVATLPTKPTKPTTK